MNVLKLIDQSYLKCKLTFFGLNYLCQVIFLVACACQFAFIITAEVMNRSL